MFKKEAGVYGTCVWEKKAVSSCGCEMCMY